MDVGFLHPGMMGASLAAACNATGLWVSGGRSAASRRRATEAGLHDVDSLDALVNRADVIVSIEGRPVERGDDIRTILEDFDVGDVVTVVVQRDGGRAELEVRLQPI